jgi:hypothetical protein
MMSTTHEIYDLDRAGTLNTYSSRNVPSESALLGLDIAAAMLATAMTLGPLAAAFLLAGTY